MRAFHNGLCAKSVRYVQALEYQMTGHFHKFTHIFRSPELTLESPENRLRYQTLFVTQLAPCITAKDVMRADSHQVQDHL